MNLAAMLDLGVPLEHLEKELKKLAVDGYKIQSRVALKMGISGTQVDVKLEQEIKPEEKYNHGHSHGHGHGHVHNHSHGHVHSTESPQHSEHRAYKDIKEIINNSTLSKEIKETSIAIFEKVAVAEAKIHNKTVDNVHFHEVGAVDSIVDIVGAAICFHYLKPHKVLCSTVELGGGFVNCAHGKFPVPAPATAEILKNIPVKLGTVNVETTTPTGAAILATLVDEFTDKPEFSIQKSCYGIGHRDMEIPNVLRTYWGEKLSSENLEKAVVLECNIDDMPPEHYEFLMDKLFNEGAHDVFITPIIMKKSRPACILSVLCSIYDIQKFENILFTESTTLGIRSYQVSKSMLSRKIQKIETKFGAIDIKIASLNNMEIKWKPEFEQCKKAAIENNVPLKIVIEEVLRNYKSSN